MKLPQQIFSFRSLERFGPHLQTDILAIIWSRKSSQITQLFSFQLHRYLLGIHLEGLRKELFYALIDSC